MKFIFFAASVFYKGSFNLFLLSPVGDPRSFLPFSLLSFPFVLNPFSPRCLSVSSPLSCFFLSLSFRPPRGSECFNNDALGIWDGRAVFFPLLPFPPPSSLSLSLALIPPSSNMSGKRQTSLNGGKWEETDAGVVMMVFIYTIIEINHIFSK